MLPSGLQVRVGKRAFARCTLYGCLPAIDGIWRVSTAAGRLRGKVKQLPASDVYVPPQRIGFRELSAPEAARVASLVDSALQAFGLKGYEVASLTKHSNVTARLVSASGPALALRLRDAPGVDVRTEYEWLDAVRRGTSIHVIETFAEALDGMVRTVEAPDGKPIECALFLWAQGRPLAAELNETNYRELGRTTALLHDFAATWNPPADLKPLVWDRTMYYENTALVFGEPDYAEYVTATQASSIERIVAEADRELARLARDPTCMFLHGNIEMWNVLVTGPGQLRLLDFEDVMFGHPVLDVAITFYYGRERKDYPALTQAYESGYRSVRTWPVRNPRQLELLTAARATMLLNYALQTETDKRSITARLLPLILSALQ